MVEWFQIRSPSEKQRYILRHYATISIIPVNDIPTDLHQLELRVKDLI